MFQDCILKNSVGWGGANNAADVKLVQASLSAVPPPKGGAFPPLDVDGMCGPLTCMAIKRFQSANTGFADGRIDAGQATEKALVALLRVLGKLQEILARLQTVKPKPTAPPVSTPNSPIRLRFMEICRQLLPPLGAKTKGGTGKKGATGCGEFPGRVFARVPVLPPGVPGAFKMKVTVPGFTGNLYLTTPMTAWEPFALEVDKKYGTKTWVPFRPGLRPLPGDIYVTGNYENPAKFQHVGVIVDAAGTLWTTADGGQGHGWQSAFVQKTCKPDGEIEGEFGMKARLRGWVDLDAMFAVAIEAFPENLT